MFEVWETVDARGGTVNVYVAVGSCRTLMSR
jgi:hypothetical protein